MEVFSKYFRRLVSGNAPQIFPGINKVVENAGNYPLLVQEMQKVSQDTDQAQKIADTIDASEGDIFRDFDLSTFLDHFKLDPLIKVALTIAFKNVNKPDLRTKGLSCLHHHSIVLCILTILSRCDPFKLWPSIPTKSVVGIRYKQGFQLILHWPHYRKIYFTPSSKSQ